jgi:hypothetical protein
VAPRDKRDGYLDFDASASCVLGSAFLGTLHGPVDVERFRSLASNLSWESQNEFVQHGLYKAFPHLGYSLASFSALRRRLAKQAPADVKYRSKATGEWLDLSYPPSLFQTITHLYTGGMSKDAVAELLGSHGL